MNKLILGTVQLGIDYGINNTIGKPSVKQSFEILKTAYDSGIRYLDTAAAYGSSEELIGSYHKQSKQQFSVITKFHSNSLQSITELVYQAAHKMNVNSIELMMFHSFNDFKQNTQVLQKLIEEKQKGSIKHIGVSVYENHEIEELLDRNEIDTIQLPFNLLDNEQHRGEVLKKAKEVGKTIHVRSVFLQGLFFREIELLPEKLIGLQKSLEKIKDISAKQKISISQLALAYVRSKRYIDGILIGVETKEQLLDNIKSSTIKLSSNTIEEIDQLNVENYELLNPSKW